MILSLTSYPSKGCSSSRVYQDAQEHLRKSRRSNPPPRRTHPRSPHSSIRFPPRVPGRLCTVFSGYYKLPTWRSTGRLRMHPRDRRWRCQRTPEKAYTSEVLLPKSSFSSARLTCTYCHYRQTQKNLPGSSGYFISFRDTCSPSHSNHTRQSSSLENIAYVKTKYTICDIRNTSTGEISLRVSTTTRLLH